MFRTQNSRLIAMTAGLAVAMLGGGCATKKYVTRTIEPVEKRVSSAEAKATEQDKTIDGLETDLSRTKEKVNDVDSMARKTSERVEVVGNQATQAQTTATAAQRQAQDARTYAETRTTEIERFIESRDKYQMAKEQHVLFKSGRAELDAEAQAALEEIAKEAQAKNRYIFEIQGYADATGSKSLNYDLSQRRAEAVVRQLTGTYKIPLRAIHLIGSGADDPVADNKTRDGRRQNRRVEVRLFVPDAGATPSQATASR
jgi:outer membrane protein OmpA-like peptidoglycan-associated protein